MISLAFEYSSNLQKEFQLLNLQAYQEGNTCSLFQTPGIEWIPMLLSMNINNKTSASRQFSDSYNFQATPAEKRKALARSKVQESKDPILKGIHRSARGHFTQVGCAALPESINQILDLFKPFFQEDLIPKIIRGL